MLNKLHLFYFIFLSIILFCPFVLSNSASNINSAILESLESQLINQDVRESIQTVSEVRCNGGCPKGYISISYDGKCVCILEASFGEPSKYRLKSTFIDSERKNCLLKKNGCWDSRLSYCFFEGDRFNGSYCGLGSYSKKKVSEHGWWKQRKEGEFCIKNFSCESNFCSNNTCIQNIFSVYKENSLCKRMSGCFISDFKYDKSCLVFNSSIHVFLNTSCNPIPFNFSLTFLEGEGICINFGERWNNSYCGLDEELFSQIGEMGFKFSPQKEEFSNCSGDFECKLNRCYNTKCISKESENAMELENLKNEIEVLKNDLISSNKNDSYLLNSGVENASLNKKTNFFYKYFWRFFEK